MAAPVWDSSGAFNATATNGATLDLACPATVNAGDLLIAHTVIRITNRGMAPTVAEQGNGWVTWRGNTTSYSASGPVGRHFIHAKIADGTEDGATVSFDVLNAGTPDNASTTPRHGQIHRFTGNATGTITDETNGDVLAGFAHVTGNNTVIQDAGVTTDEADCLAVNLVYVSDDNAPFGSFTGETGGDWVHRAEGETNLGSDGAQMLQTAEMASAGTVDGGTYTMGAADPFGTFGFFIRPAAGAGAFEIDAQPGSYALTGAPTGVLAGRVINAAPGSYALTGVGALLQRGRFINAEPGSYALTGAQAGVLADRLINAAAGSYSLTGAPIGAVAGRVLVAQPGSYEYTGFAAELVYDTGAQAFELNAEPGTYALTGADTGLLADRMIVAAPGSYSLTGAQAGLLVDRVLSAEPGAYTLTGSPASTLTERVLVALPGEYNLTGFLTGLVQEGVAVYIPPAEGTIEIIRPEGVFSIVQDAEGGIVVIGPEGEIWLIT